MKPALRSASCPGQARVPRAPTLHMPTALRPEGRGSGRKQPPSSTGQQTGALRSTAASSCGPRGGHRLTLSSIQAASPGRTHALGLSPTRCLFFSPASREQELSGNQDLNPDGRASSRPPAAQHAWRDLRHCLTSGCLGRLLDAPTRDRQTEGHLTYVRDEDGLLQRDVRNRGAGLADAHLGRFALVPHLPQLRVFEVGSNVSLSVA